MYGVVRPGARARDFEESLMWLDDYGIITRVPRAPALRTPLSSYADPAVFKLFVSDIGLLGALADLDHAFRMAMTDYRDEGWITNFPCGRPSGSAPTSRGPTAPKRRLFCYGQPLLRYG